MVQSLEKSTTGATNVALLIAIQKEEGVRLIVVPLKLELQPMLSAFTEMGLTVTSKQHKGFWFWELREKNIVFSLGGLGKAQFALQSQYALDHLKDVKHLICVGAAGGLTAQVKPFDIVCATEVVEHDYKERFKATSAFLRHDVDGTWIEQLRNLAQTKHRLDLPNLHFGAVASGDEDIVCRERADELNQTTKALAVAWEGAGGARTAKFNRIPYNEFRGISDSACSNAPHDFSKNLPGTMRNLAQLIAIAF